MKLDDEKLLARLAAHELILVELLTSKFGRFPPEMRQALRDSWNELPDLGGFLAGADIGRADQISGFALAVRDARNHIERKALEAADGRRA
jgi:hypothetical protein